MTSLDFGPTTTSLAAIVRGVRDDQLGDPTPSTGRSVGDLLDHIGGLAVAFTDAARKSAPPGGTWDRVRPVYQLGHTAAANPAYRGRSFADIETDIQHGWTAQTRSSPGEWQSVRDLARAAYEHRANTTRAEMDLADPSAGGERLTHASSRPDFGPHSPAVSRREFRTNP